MTGAVLAAVREYWGWTGIDAEAVTAVSPFGHLIVRDRAGAFWYLDPEIRTLACIAQDEPGLFAYMAQPDVRELWLAEALVERARAAIGAPPDEDRCYALSIARLLAGDYSADDFWHPPVAELIGVMGDIEARTRGLPDGTEVQLKIVD